jgi:predicted TIM-barrel fold metal-dependent hydrolase
VVCVFARKTAEPLASLVKQIDEKIGENRQLKSFVVVLSDQGAKAAEELKKLARDAGIKNVPLTLHQDPAGLPDYELARNADVTVLMWRGHKVVSGHGFKGALSDKDVRAILDDIPKLLSD